MDVTGLRVYVTRYYATLWRTNFTDDRIPDDDHVCDVLGGTRVLFLYRALAHNAQSPGMCRVMANGLLGWIFAGVIDGGR